MQSDGVRSGRARSARGAGTTSAAAGDSLWISITGPRGAKPFIGAEFSLVEETRASDAATGDEGASTAAASGANAARPAPLEPFDLAAFRDAFNRADNIVRVVALLSPT